MVRALLPACLFIVGCAPVGMGPPVVTDVPRGSEIRDVPSGAREASITEDGLVVTVVLAQHCTVARFDTTERTSVRSLRNDAPALDVLAALGGAFLVGSGVTGVARPATGADIDSRLSSSQTRGIGYGLIGAGIALLAIPVLDWERSHGVAERKVARVSTVAAVVEEDRPCGAPARGTQVFARFPSGQDAYLGASDRDGRVTGNLDASADAKVRLVLGERAAVHADGVDVGTISLDALYTVREGAAWRKLEASRCPASFAETDCAGEAAYAELFPEGAHIAETRRRLDAAVARRRAAAERLAYARLDLGSCRAPVRADDAEACGPLEAFRRAYPESAHAAEVDRALLAGRTARAKLEEEETKAAAAREREERERAHDAYESSAVPIAIVPYAGGRRAVPASPRRRAAAD